MSLGQSVRQFYRQCLRPTVSVPAFLAIYLALIGWVVNNQIVNRQDRENKVDRTIRLADQLLSTELSEQLFRWAIYFERDYYTQRKALTEPNQVEILTAYVKAKRSAADRMSEQLGHKVDDFVFAKLLLSQADRIGMCVQREHCDADAASIFFTKPIYSVFIWWRHLVYCDKKLNGYFSENREGGLQGDFLDALIEYQAGVEKGKRSSLHPMRVTCELYRKLTDEIESSN